MNVARTRRELAGLLSTLGEGRTGFVPTMGALHKGHISLVEAARKECTTTIVSIFVNPTQFNDKADLGSYPRTPEADLELLEKAGTDIVFMPTPEEVYPEPDTRIFDFGVLDKVMEGATRPGHFNGVAQVVSRLFELVAPHRAYFGEKDFQQVAIVRELVRQTSSPVEIVTCPTMRDSDGLALSSRNALLSREHRTAAPEIYRLLTAGRNKIGEMTPAEVEKYVTKRIDSNPFLKVIYFNIVNSRTLSRAESWDSADGIQGCIAVQAGNVRLIDNIRLV